MSLSDKLLLRQSRSLIKYPLPHLRQLPLPLRAPPSRQRNLQ